jgi:hypothetical protein
LHGDATQRERQDRPRGAGAAPGDKSPEVAHPAPRHSAVPRRSR